MRKAKFIIDDPDKFWSHVDKVDTEGNIHLTIKEGELPIRPPAYSYRIVEEEEGSSEDLEI